MSASPGQTPRSLFMPRCTCLGMLDFARIYKINFKANCICRDGVWVDVIKPALPMGLPLESKIFRLSRGGAKFVWFRRLKNSALNWTLNESEIRLMRLFFSRDESRLISPGPISVFLPKLPRSVIGFGTARHCVLM